MTLLIAPPLTPADQRLTIMREQGMVVMGAADVCAAVGVPMEALAALTPAWERLSRDEYLKDGGRYRLRRHSCFVVSDGVLTQTEHRAHYQPVEYNALHGGMRRWFEPMEAEVAAHPAWQSLIKRTAQMCSEVDPVVQSTDVWHIEAHQFRIDTTDGIGRPTPEGAHRDGVDFVMVFLLDRVGIKGGETRVFEANGSNGQRFTLTEPWSLLWMNDAKVIHESTPIQPTAEHGHRDTLVLTFRRGGFLGDDAIE